VKKEKIDIQKTKMHKLGYKNRIGSSTGYHFENILKQQEGPFFL
jgi:hypothetical protein